MRNSRKVAKAALPVSIAAAMVLALPVIVFGHAVVFPKTSTTGTFERYVLRVPNEKTVATTRVEIRFPADVRVTSFEDVPGWQLAVLTDSAKRITGAVWTGTLPPQRFVEFPFSAANPKTETRVSWPAFQTYADGEVVEWTGPEGSKRPASSTVIQAAGAAAAGGTPVVAWIALALALVAMGLALRPRSTTSLPS